MGLQLPGELVSLLGMLGYNWPESDETRLFEMGQRWLGFNSTLTSAVGEFNSVAQRVWSDNKGDGMAAFQNRWGAEGSPAPNLDTGSLGAAAIGGGLMLTAGVVLVLKINVIVQLVQLAIEIFEAVATAIETFGASLLEIPIFKEITSLLLDQLINLALNQLMGG
ncbi:hypothetical protein [Actinoallomurus sp. NPDC052274]|uniref:WXG100-like domain-containing protein n=1 Tax=Actinoallomurus sp. NPDC052274 TaxID=3155420 RepID=UPI00341B62FD